MNKQQYCKIFSKRLSVLAAATLFLSACGGIVTSGGQNAGVTGAAAGSRSEGDSGLEHCQASLGTIAVDNGRNSDWIGQFGSATKVTTIDPLLRLAIQQSNCFVITSIGNQTTDSNLTRITQQQRDSGEYRSGSKQEKGQRVAADYFMEPAIVINDTVGGLKGTLSGLITNKFAASAASNLDAQTVVVTLTLYDVRSATQIAAAEGSATATNYGAALGLLGSKAGGTLSGFSQTPAGKASVVAFIDAYNKMVVALRSYKAQDVEGGMGRGGHLKVN
jgi:hypothetical protein